MSIIKDKSIIKDNPIFTKQPLVRVSQNDCLNNYKIFENPKFKRKSKKNNNSEKMNFRKTHNALPIIEGMEIEKKNIKETVLLEPYYEGHSFFYNDSFYIVPKEYNEIKITNKKRKELKSRICKKTPKKIIDLENKGLYWQIWKNETRNKWLTIKDIQNLKKGQEIKILLLDRNVDDRFETDENIKPNKLYKPKKFFNSCWAVYKHIKDLKGEIFYQWQEEKIKKFNSNQKGGSTFKVENRHNNSKPYEFEFEIEYKHNNWHPLENGFLPAKNYFRKNLLDGKKKKWDKFPKNTKVGFRGPMILWEDLDKLPNIYYLDLVK